MKYPGMTFQDQHGRAIEINEELTLRDALDTLELTLAAMRKAANAEAMAGQSTYEAAKKVTKAARRLVAEDKANAQAAFYRATGRWPMALRDLEVC